MWQYQEPDFYFLNNCNRIATFTRNFNGKREIFTDNNVQLRQLFCVAEPETQMCNTLNVWLI